MNRLFTLKNNRARFAFTRIFQKLLTLLSIFSLSFLTTGCEEGNSIVKNIGEREANVIVVFLASKGIEATKVLESSSGAIGGENTGPKYSIQVSSSQATNAMAILNQNGLPQIKGPSLLELFAKQGLMSSDKEESIRYQAGLSQQIANTILMIDGVIDASVQISFPDAESGNPLAEENNQERITAAIYVKHQGVLDDPNSYLETKIKRLVSGSVTGLDIADVTVVSDRSRFTDVSPMPDFADISPKGNDYVKVWSMVMSKSSVTTFRFVFFLITTLAILLAVILGWVIWKIYPIINAQGGFAHLLSIKNQNPPESEEVLVDGVSENLDE